MHKINRIGNAAAGELGRENTTPVVSYTGTSITSQNINHHLLSLTDGQLDGHSFHSAPSSTFTLSQLTRGSFGGQATLDPPFADSIGVEFFGMVIATLPLGAYITPVIGHLGAFGTSLMEIETLTDFCHVEKPANNTGGSATHGRHVYAWDGVGVLRRTSAAPIKMGYGILFTSIGADATSCAITSCYMGYKTLNDQYNHNYYDPAR